MPSSPSGLPYAMQRTPVRSGNGRHSLANGFDKRLQVLQRSITVTAMTEIEYVARAAACAAEHVARAFGDAFDRSEQHRRVQVPLHAQGRAETPPALVEADAPVERDDVRAGGGNELEQPRGGGTEVDPGHAQRAGGLEDAPRERKHASLVVGG